MSQAAPATIPRRCRRVARHVLAAMTGVALGLTLLVSSLALADEPVRVFLRFEGDKKEVAAIEAARLRFDSVLLRDGQVALAGTAEMDGVYADCRERIGVSATEVRECRLQAARRIFVEQVLEVAVQKLSRKRFEMALKVWNPDSNAMIFADLLEVEADDAGDAARAALPRLAEAYVCWHHGASGCTAQAALMTEGTTTQTGHTDPNDNTTDAGQDPKLARGPLTTAEVKAAFVARKDDIAGCAKDKPGKLAIVFTVARDGAAKDVHIEPSKIESSDTGRCLVQLVDGLHFRPSGRELSIRFPLAFK